MEFDFLMKIVFEYLEPRELAIMACVNRATKQIASGNDLWKKHLRFQFKLPETLLIDPIWRSTEANGIFKNVYLKLARAYKVDFFLFYACPQRFLEVPFLIALAGSPTLLAEYEVDHNVDLHREDSEGRNALHYSVIGRNTNMFERLMGRVNLISSKPSRTNLLQIAAISGNLMILQKVINLRMFELQAVDERQRDLIYLTVMSGNIASLRFLLSLPDAPSIDNTPDSLSKMTALHIAADRGFQDIFMLLVKQGNFNLADVDGQGSNVSHYAHRNHSKEISSFLASQPAINLNVANRYGFFPADYANNPHPKRAINKSARRSPRAERFEPPKESKNCSTFHLG
jgi:ankyrin repeat protein